MKSSIFRLASFALMGASVCAHELLRAGVAITGDEAPRAAGEVARPHVVRFDNEDEGEDWCGPSCLKCRGSCHFSDECREAGILNGGHNCRVACRCKNGCEKDSDVCRVPRTPPPAPAPALSPEPTPSPSVKSSKSSKASKATKPACSFCPGGMPDPEHLLPTGDGSTCAIAQAFADSLMADDKMCATVQSAESICCP